MKRNLQTPVSLAEIAQGLGAELRGDPSVTVRRLASLRKADMLASSAWAVQMLLVALSRRMCCSRVCSAMR